MIVATLGGCPDLLYITCCPTLNLGDEVDDVVDDSEEDVGEGEIIQYMVISNTLHQSQGLAVCLPETRAGVGAGVCVTGVGVGFVSTGVGAGGVSTGAGVDSTRA